MQSKGIGPSGLTSRSGATCVTPCNNYLCMDVSNGSPTGNLQIWQCNQTPAQKFTAPAMYPGAFVSGVGTNNCMDSAGGAIGARAKLAPCNGGAAQQWTFRLNSYPASAFP